MLLTSFPGQALPGAGSTSARQGPRKRFNREADGRGYCLKDGIGLTP